MGGYVSVAAKEKQQITLRIESYTSSIVDPHLTQLLWITCVAFRAV